MPGFDSITGQEKAVTALSAFLKSGNIPHALLFSGITGSGKLDAAQVFAMSCNCARQPAAEPVVEPCGVCRACRKITSGQHPDVLDIRPAGKQVKVDQIRALLDTIALKPFEATVRVIRIHDAHTMNPSAANAILKALEEPPPQTVFILLSDQVGRMLPTIISRCQKVRFVPVPEHVISQHLIDNFGVSGEAALATARMCGGNIGVAEQMMSQAWRQCRRQALAVLGNASEMDAGQLLAAAGHLAGQKKVPMADIVHIIGCWVRDVMVWRCRPKTVINMDVVDKIQYTAERTTMDTVLRQASAVSLARQRLEYNANPKLVLENLLMAVARPADARSDAG